MPFAANFDKHMKRVLKEKFPKLQWKVGWYPAGLRWRVDLTGLQDKDPRVFIEAELKKDDPAANVTKIWRWAHEKSPKKKILFVQGFSRHYWNKKTRLRERAEFIGERMNEANTEIHYHPAKIEYKNKKGKVIHFKPRVGPGFSAKKGAGRLKQAAEGFADEVAKLIRRNHIA